MRKLSLFLLAAMLFVAGTAVTSAQTYTGTVGQFNCGQLAVSCDGLPLLLNNGTELVNESIWFDQNVEADFVVFPLDPLGLDTSNPNLLAKITSPIQQLSTAKGTQTIYLMFSGTDSKGKAYSGAMNLHYTTYLVVGRGGGGWHWVVTGGTVAITYPPSSSGLTVRPMANDPCFGGQIIPGPYQPTGWRLLIADWWWGEACWVDGSVKYVIYDYPLL